MERGDVSMTNGFLAPGVHANFFDREIDFDEAFGILICHSNGLVFFRP